MTLATYLPPWAGSGDQRVAGIDEDAVTMAVAAGMAALDGASPSRIEIVTRDMVLLEGGSSAVLCAGLGQPDSTEVIERLGGAATALDAIANARAGSLVIGVDAPDGSGAGAGAIHVTDDNAIEFVTRVQRSLPVVTKHPDGRVYQDEDPRLMRESGLRASFERAALPTKPSVIAGLSAREAKPFAAAGAPSLPTAGASSPFFALAAVASGSTVAAVEQATVSAATVNAELPYRAVARPAQPIPARKDHPGPDIKIALTAYDRAFESKLRWEAAACNQCGTLALPQRHRCIECGAEADSTLTPLPRTGAVYTQATIHVPVPGLQTPYTLAVVEMDEVGVRSLVRVTDVPASSTEIGDQGDLVFRRVAVRSGVPDYGYAFSPRLADEGGVA